MGKEYVKAVYCHPAIYVEYIMGNIGVDEAQAGLKTTAEISTALDVQMIPF